MDNQQHQNRLHEIERMVHESLNIAKENRSFLVKIDRRQRWARNWTTFYWAVVVVLALLGYFYAFPYLKDIRDNVSSAWKNVSLFVQPASSSN